MGEIFRSESCLNPSSPGKPVAEQQLRELNLLPRRHGAGSRAAEAAPKDNPENRCLSNKIMRWSPAPQGGLLGAAQVALAPAPQGYPVNKFPF